MAGGKIFYIGFQRVGTKSFGRFMEMNGYRVASWDTSSQNNWSAKFFNGKFKEILGSKSFINAQVFEDGPWYQPALVKYLYHEFPDAKFILLTRPPDDWFKSMITHSGGTTLGDTQLHCEAYDRLDDYDWLVKNASLARKDRLSLFDKPQHYISVYKKKTIEVILFFERMKDSAERVFIGELYDDTIYRKIARFLKIENPIFTTRISHKSYVYPKNTVEDICKTYNDIFKNHMASNIYCSVNNVDDEIAALRDNLALDQNNYNILFHLGTAFFNKNDPDEAMRLAEQALSHCNDCSRLHFLLSRIWLKKKNTKMALKCIDAAIALIDDNPFYHHFRAAILRENKMFDEAIQAQKKAVALAPENPAFLDALQKDHMSHGE